MLLTDAVKYKKTYIKMLYDYKPINMFSESEHNSKIGQLILIPLEFLSLPDGGGRGLTTALLLVVLTSDSVKRHLVILKSDYLKYVPNSHTSSVPTVSTQKNKTFLKLWLSLYLQPCP